MTLHAVYTVFRKELGDHFGSNRFTILFALITMVSLIMVYMAGLNLREALEGSEKPQFCVPYAVHLDGGIVFHVPVRGVFSDL